MLQRIAPYAKAVVAFLTPGLVALGAAVTDSSAGGSSITAGEWIGIALASLGTAGLVFAVPNATPEREPELYVARHTDGA